MTKDASRIGVPNHSRFNFDSFKERLTKAQSDYNIRVAEGYNPHKRSAKRIAIFVSEAYLTSGGSIHWVQDLEAEVFKLCKEYYLDCDPLEMEQIDRSYICRKKGKKGSTHRDYGKKFFATQFDNHLVNETNISKEDVPLARAIVHLFTHNFYKKEDENGTKYYSGKGVVSITGNKQSKPLPAEKRERITLCQPNQNREDLSSRKIYGLDKAKLRK